MADNDPSAGSSATTTAPFDIRLELVILPVADVDRAKAFYVDQLGFHLDADTWPTESMRVVQMTPPGSACSVAFGRGLTTAAPGSVVGLQVVVDDADAMHDHLAARGVQVEPVVDLEWGRFVYFADPDGNRWAAQQLPARG